MTARLARALLLAGPFVFALLLFKHLAYPVLWNDEAETIMYGLRVLEYGYPKVHGPRNTVYPYPPLPEEIAIDPASDAYVGTTWGHFYLGALGALLASGVEDPYAQTLRLRLPFALVGWLGLCVLLAVVVPALPTRRARVSFVCLFFWLACAEVSLVLHLREARYPPLLVLLSSLVLLGWTRGGGGSRAGGRLLAGAALVGVFHVFFPAFLALGAGLAADRLVAAWAGTRSRRVGSVLSDLTPLFGAALVVAPLLDFFDTLRVTAAHAELAPTSVAGSVANLGRMLAFLARHEHLGLVLVMRTGLVVSGRLAADRGEEVWEGRARELARTLLVVAAVYSLVMAQSPSLFERYLTPLGPWLSAVALLDGARLWSRLRSGASAPGRPARGLLAALAGLAGLTLAWHAPDVAGRWHEIWTRYRGPMDEAIAFLRATYGETRELVVATNYEGPVLMYYLGARVRGADQLREEGLAADVVIARRHHLPGTLAPAAHGQPYQVAVLPVRDLPFNNIPELYRWKPLLDYDMPTHQYRTPRPHHPQEGLRIRWRPLSR